MRPENLLEDYAEEGTLAKALGTSRRSIKRAREEPDGLAFIKWAGKVFIHLPSARKYFERKTQHPNPRRGKRRS